MRRHVVRACFWSFTLLLAVEAGSRVLGLTDFPIYIVDDGVGYTVKPNQAGNFMIVNGWSFNDRGMGTSRAWNPNLKENILLVGNSIIMGGNPYRQEEKIGPLLEHLLAERYSVWPIAVGGWTNVNEAAVLERNKDVVSDSQFIIVEYMNGGFQLAKQMARRICFSN